MKYLTLPYVCFLALGWATHCEEAHFVAHTSPIQHFTLIVDGKETPIESLRADGTFFEFSCDPSKTKLRLENEKCVTPPIIKICKSSKKQCTDTMSFNCGEAILVENCLDYLSSSLLTTIKDFLYDIYQTAPMRAALSSGRQSPSFQGGDKPKAGDPKIDFKAIEGFHYVDSNDINIEFQIYEDYPIKKISIVSNKRINKRKQLLFCAGDGAETTAKVFGYKGKIPPIDSILEELPSTEKGQNRYRINGEKLAKNLFNRMYREKGYQLAVYVENDTSGHQPYLYNFYLVSEREKQLIQMILPANDERK